MEQNKLEFFKTIKKMIDYGSTSSEIFKKINDQSSNIKSEFSYIEIWYMKVKVVNIIQNLNK